MEKIDQRKIYTAKYIFLVFVLKKGFVPFSIFNS